MHVFFLFFLLLYCSSTPPKLIHFGQQKYLLEDRKINTIPTQVWEGYVMGEKNNWNLPEVRRGLYGAGFNASQFAPSCKGKKRAWLMVIYLNKDCQKQNKIADLRTLPKSKEFHTWYKNSKLPSQYFRNIDDFFFSCYGLKKNENISRRPLIRYHKEYTIPKNYGIRDNYLIHEKILDTFLRDTNKALIKDDIFASNSWYIRDRKCIKEIKSFPDELLNEIKNDPTFWNYIQAENPREIGSMSFILFYSFASVKNLSSEFMDEFIKSVPGGDFSWKPSSIISTYQVVREYYNQKREIRIEIEAEGENNDHNHHHASKNNFFDIKVYLDILQEMRVCAAKNKQAPMQKKLKEILDSYERDCKYLLSDIKKNIQLTCTK